jgi:hypothetical protein
MAPSLPPMMVGPFQLVEPLARGGMAEVWRGLHAAQGVPVAVKVVTGELARQPRFRSLFRNEVRAMARLSHPHVITVLDHGEIDAETSRREPRLVAGSPWLVMELASGGSLSNPKQPLSWPTVRGILLALLDALAHAHARGVIHRDVKPGNVLSCTTADARPGWKLTDFGIAQAADGSASAVISTTSGTLQYMAPEQVRGDALDQGPWTDLYAVGCLTWRLVCGSPPFKAYRGHQLAQAQLEFPPPEFKAIRLVPEGLDAWVGKLLAKSPRQRFQHAADAAWALAQLPSVRAEDLFGPDEAVFAGGDYEPTAFRGALQASKRRDTAARAAATAPPVPPGWDRPRVTAPAALTGAGLGLYGLRSFPVVGRKTERDKLWKALTRVHETRRCELVLVEGPAGIGKSRMVEWMAQRAAEVGAATVLRAVGDTSGSAGLGRMVERVVHAAGLDPDEVVARVQDALGETDDPSDDARAIAEMIAPTARVRHVETAAERYALLTRFVARYAQDRPVILWLEDAHVAADAIGFARHVLGVGSVPVLLVLTARTDAGRDEARLAEVMRHARAQRITLGPLATADTRALVAELLVLDEAFAARLEERTQGNPAFAIQLVGDLVQRGLLVAGPRGFRVRPGAIPALPDDLHTVWTSRVERVLQGLPPAARARLERGAVLGREVDQDEWEEVCGYGALVGGRVHDAKALRAWQATAELLGVIVERLLAMRLVEETGNGWTFRDPLFRESLERSARDGDRLVGHHEACATMLVRRVEQRRPRANERLGRHRFAAGAWDAAFEPLIEGSRELGRAVGQRPALGLLGLAEEALHAANAPTNDVRWGKLALDRVDLTLRGGDLAAGLAECDRLLELARANGWKELYRAALVSRGPALRFVVGPEAALAASRELLALAKTAGDEAQVIDALMAIAYVQAEQREPAAIKTAEQAVAKAKKRSDDVKTASALRCLGVVRTMAGDYPLAIAPLVDAIAAAEACGARATIASATSALASAQRLCGDLVAATESYRRAADIMEQIGSGNIVIPRFYLASLRMGRGEHAAARDELDAMLPGVQTQGWKGLRREMLAALLECTAVLGDWPAWDKHLAAIRTLAKERGVLDPDMPAAIERAALIADEGGHLLRGWQGLTVALEYWQALGDGDAVDRIRARMAKPR